MANRRPKVSTQRRESVTLEFAYGCAYCGKPMYHRGDFQPSIIYAECWRCWQKRVEELLAAERKRVQVLSRVVVVAPVGAFIAGWIIGLMT